MIKNKGPLNSRFFAVRWTVENRDKWAVNCIGGLELDSCAWSRSTKACL